MSFHRPLPAVLAPLLFAGCAATSTSRDDHTGRVTQRFSSPQARPVEMTWRGYVDTDLPGGASDAIDTQALFTVGQLNGDSAVGQLDKLTVSGLITTPGERGGWRTAYEAKLPVAWGGELTDALPKTYSFVLPRDVSTAGLTAFTAKYRLPCGTDDSTVENIWYRYRPNAADCVLDDADVVRMTVAVAPATTLTTGKYPEYHKVWEDGALNVVAIFTTYDPGVVDGTDLGVKAFNEFAGDLSASLAPYTPVTTPAVLPPAPAPAIADFSIAATLPDGKKVNVTALLIESVPAAGKTFSDRYAGLTARADLISYNGHADHGVNIRTLGTLGKFVPKQYVIVSMNSCDTYAYLNESLAKARAVLNPDDPTGTKYMDVVSNGRPNYFTSLSMDVMALIDGLLAYDEPKTFDTILKAMDPEQLPLVTGEEDNVYAPGMK